MEMDLDLSTSQEDPASKHYKFLRQLSVDTGVDIGLLAKHYRTLNSEAGGTLKKRLMSKVELGRIREFIKRLENGEPSIRVFTEDEPPIRKVMVVVEYESSKVPVGHLVSHIHEMPGVVHCSIKEVE